MHSHSLPITDCHTHIIGDTSRYPMTAPRAYTPAPASTSELARMLTENGIDRVVLVQLSSYGDDNSCMLEALAQLSKEARCVVHTNTDTCNADLDNMHAQRARGIRINLNSNGVNDPAQARAQLQLAASHCARNGWHIQMHTTPNVLCEIAGTISDCPVPVVLDHFGLTSVSCRGSKGETAIRHLLADGQLWVKLSGTYRLDNPDAGALARDLYADNPHQIVWGSDWPHTSTHDGALKDNPPILANRHIKATDLLEQCVNWFEDGIALERVLYKNAEQLYGFGQSEPG